MKRPTTLLRRVLLDEGLQVGLTIERDFQEIESRFKHEGMSFLTITLPLLSDTLEKGLETGRITTADFPGFKPASRRRSLPALLSGFFMRVFECDGRLLDEPCIASVRAIRQISRLFKKVELPCSSARRKAAFERYKSNDEGLCWTGFRSPSDASIYASVAGYLWSDLEELSGELYCFPGIFGSGATAERLLFNERHTIRKWPIRSEPWFPSDYHTTHDFSTGIDDIEFHGESDELPVRVVQVPKTLKTPRTISVEPSYMMLMQQSIAKPLMDYLEGRFFPFKSIRFSDQSENRRLARVGSVDRSLGTIDLSDASDLVSNNLVVHTFRGVCPTFLEFIQACRSTRAQMPDKTILKLNKFASQGSALCFPIEAMVFFTIILYSMVKQSGRVPSRQLLMSLAADVAVYGDDIIVPAKMVPGVEEDLESFGLKVNRNKSYHKGFFRESCGGDYYKGVDVTPTYVRQWDFSGALREATQLTAYVSLSNQLYVKGMWHACHSIRIAIDNAYGPLPYSRYPSGYLHHASLLRSSGLWWDKTRSGYRVRGIVPSVVKQSDSPRGLHGYMLRAFSATAQRDSRRNLRVKELGALNRSFLFQDTHGDLEPNGGFRCDSGPSRPCVSYSFRRAVLRIDRGSYAEIASRGGSSIQKVSYGLLKELRTLSDNSLHTSVRPYALKVKRRWTPAPSVGLAW
nr:MAG: hypothetical protein 3 [Leviviridae sp.]